MTILAYREFFDIPRAFLIEPEPKCLILFDCPFDEELDVYPAYFVVFALGDLNMDSLPSDWSGLAEKSAGPLGKVSVSAMRFDETRRRQVTVEGLADLIELAERAVNQLRHPSETRDAETREETREGN